VLTYILLRGVKKFGQLILVQPYHSSFGIERRASFAISCIINNYILVVIIHSQNGTVFIYSSKCVWVNVSDLNQLRVLCKNSTHYGRYQKFKLVARLLSDSISLLGIHHALVCSNSLHLG